MKPKYVYADLFDLENALIVFRKINSINHIVKSAFSVMESYILRIPINEINITATNNMAERIIYFSKPKA
jgi:hypothetical protein